MAFQNLRVGGKLYILHKDNSIRIEEAEVTNITMPTMRFMPQGMNQTMNIKVLINIYFVVIIQNILTL